MLPLKIALRYLFSKKSHNAVNIISTVSMVGVGVATAAIICVLSVFNGFARLNSQRMSRVNPELILLPAHGKIIPHADSLAMRIARLPEIAAALPTISEQALVMYANRQMPATVLGLSQAHSAVTDIAPLAIDGVYSPDSSASLSVGVAARLGAHPGIGIPLALYAPKRVGRINPANPLTAFVSDSITIGSVFEAGETEFDTRTVIIPIHSARRLFNYPHQATSVFIAANPGADISKAKKQVADTAGPSCKVLTRPEQQYSSFRMIAIEKWITFTMLAFILVIASFNVISSLSMIIIEKRADMQTLRALGATPGTIRSIFLWEGWLVTMLGGIGGAVAGVLLSLTQQYGQFIKLAADPSKLTITAYPVQVQPLDTLIVVALVASLGFLIGLLVSRTAQ